LIAEIKQHFGVSVLDKFKPAQDPLVSESPAGYQVSSPVVEQSGQLFTEYTAERIADHDRVGLDLDYLANFQKQDRRRIGKDRQLVFLIELPVGI
jgi:hypothetical protein